MPAPWQWNTASSSQNNFQCYKCSGGLISTWFRPPTYTSCDPSTWACPYRVSWGQTCRLWAYFRTSKRPQRSSPSQSACQGWNAQRHRPMAWYCPSASAFGLRWALEEAFPERLILLWLFWTGHGFMSQSPIWKSRWGFQSYCHHCLGHRPAHLSNAY